MADVTIGGLTQQSPVSTSKIPHENDAGTDTFFGTLAQFNSALDHGSLSGLADDDHTMYMKKSSNLSDVVSATNARLNILPSYSGNSNKVLAVNGTENDVTWVTAASGVSDGDKGDITVSGSGATWSIDNNVVTDGKLRDSTNLSVIGRSVNSTGDPSDIIAGSDGAVLRRSGTSLGFGTIGTNGYEDNSVIYTKLQDISAASKLLGRGSSNGAGDPEEITLGSGLSMSGTTLSVTGGGGGAPTDAQYVTLVADGSLSAERVLTAGANVTIADGTSIVTVAAGTTSIVLPGDISPSTLSADQNDWNPTDLSTAAVIRVSGDNAVRSITGLQGGSDGRIIILHNVGSFSLLLVNESASSSAANRIAIVGGDYVLFPKQMITLQYDSTSSRWRLGGGVQNLPNFYTGDPSSHDYYHPTNFLPTNASITLTAARGYSIPIKLDYRSKIGTVAIYVSGSASGTAYHGLYEWGSGTTPGALIVDFGSVSTASTGWKTTTSASWTSANPLLLPPGMYWYFMNNSGTPSMRSMTPNIPVLGNYVYSTTIAYQYGSMSAAGAPNATWSSNFTGGQTGVLFGNSAPAVLFGP